MLKVRGITIFDDEKPIGFFRQIRELNVARADVIALYDEQCVAVLKKLCLPHVFTYVWIQDISLIPEYRRRGIAGKIINKISKPNTLIACAPGTGSGNGKMRMNHMGRLAFYESLDFSLVIAKNDYAFKYIPDEKTRKTKQTV